MSRGSTRGPVVAVCGKGGVGKTTVSALLAAAVVARGRTVLAVDADHAGGLTMVLDMSPARTLADVRLVTTDEAGRRGTARADLVRSLDYQLVESLEERDGLALLAMGRPEDRGCYCGVNRLLREAIARLASELDVTIVDAEAGIEQVNREVLGEVDRLVLVADTSARALKVAEAVAALAGERGEAVPAGLVINRVRDEAEARAVARRTVLPILAVVLEDAEVRRSDAEGRSLLELGAGPARDAVTALAARLGLIAAPPPF